MAKVDFELKLTGEYSLAKDYRGDITLQFSVESSEILDHFGPREVATHFNADDLLDEIGVDATKDKWRLPQMSNLTLSTSVVIDDKPVEKQDFKIGLYDVYRVKDSNDSATLYFVDSSGAVVGKVDIEADYGQACGFVSDISGVSYL